MKRFVVLIGCLLSYTLCSSQNLYFPPVGSNIWDTLSPLRMQWCPKKIESLYRFLEAKNTKAFIVIKDGKIVLEKYFGTFKQDDPWLWASSGKTLTAFLVGIAQQEGKLLLSEPTSKYLGQGWTSCTAAQELKITLRHQLTMTSGLDDGVPDHFCTLDTCLRYKTDAGKRWAYHNGPYTLLDKVLEAAVGSSVNVYMNQKIKKTTGMTGSFLPVDYNNVYFRTARSMARFGLLMLNKGRWNEDTILYDTSYYRQMTSSSQDLNAAYGYLWWLNGKSSFRLPQTQLLFEGALNPNAPQDMIAALGKNGQFLNIVPSENMVWVRMGDAPEGADVPFMLNDEIWMYINGLSCDPLSATEKDELFLVNVFDKTLRLNTSLPMRKIEVLTIGGKIVKDITVSSDIVELEIRSLDTGMHFVRVTLSGGQRLTKKLIVQ